MNWAEFLVSMLGGIYVVSQLFACIVGSIWWVTTPGKKKKSLREMTWAELGTFAYFSPALIVGALLVAFVFLACKVWDFLDKPICGEER
jgi:hypothetical protein